MFGRRLMMGTYILLAYIFAIATIQAYAAVKAPVLSAPSGWKLSWTSSQNRLSTGPSSAFLRQRTLEQSATTMTQQHIDTCVLQCKLNMLPQCAFVNVVKVNEKRGPVLCNMYARFVSSSKATYKTVPATTSGGDKVAYSYGVRSFCAPITGAALTCTPALNVVSSILPTVSTSGATSTPLLTERTSTKSLQSSNAPGPAPTDRAVTTYPFTLTNDSSLPSARKGATLIDWVPSACKRANLTVPAMINDAFLQGDKKATTAYISQHGAGSDFDSYFSLMHKYVGDGTPLISPGFLTDDGVSPFYRRGINLAWDSAGDSWAVGNDDTTGASCSSFDMYDTMIDYIARSGRFPRVKTISIIAHSGGGNMMNRFSTINTNNPVTIKYVLVNAASQVYFTDARPVNGTACGTSYHWPFQYTGRLSRYVAKRFTDGNVDKLFTRWRARPVTYLVGDRDIGTGGTQSCQSQAQGGRFRRDRNYAYWAYINILAGTKTDVSAYYGYKELLASDAKQMTASSSGFNQQFCTVSGASHSADEMYASACGQAAIFGRTLPKGAGASYPPGTLQSDDNDKPSFADSPLGSLTGILGNSLGGLGKRTERLVYQGKGRVPSVARHRRAGKRQVGGDATGLF